MSGRNYLLSESALENFDIDDPNWESSKERKEECKQCRAKFQTKDQLSEHLKCHPDFPCIQCPKTFKNKHYLAQHMITHNGDGQRHECSTCFKVFKRRNTLLDHLKTHTSATTCTICKKLLGNEKSLRAHMKYVHCENLKLIKCEICQSTFKRKYLLDQHKSDVHLKSSENAQGHPCKICGKLFKRKKSISRHVRDKHGDSPGYNCEKCGKHYLRRAPMTEHAKICDGTVSGHRNRNPKTQEPAPKNFLCHLCSSSFTTSYGLNRHLDYQHSKRFQCHICHKKCHYEKQIVDHLKRAHNCDPPEELKDRKSKTLYERTEDGKVVCPICSKQFTRTNHLRYHKRKEHGAIFPKKRLSLGRLQKRICPFCGKGIMGKPNYVAHINFHTGNRQYKCPLCPVKVTARSNLNVHIKSAHYFKNPLYCRACNKLFCSKEKFDGHAQELHIGKHPFVCTKCYSGFDHEAKYQNHIAKSHRYKTPDEEKKFRCNVCEKRFVFRHSIVRHMLRCKLQPPITPQKAEEKHDEIGNNTVAVLNNITHDSFIFEFVCKICFSIFNGNRELIEHFVKEHSKSNLPDETLLCVNTRTEGRKYGCKDEYFTSISASKLVNKEPFFCGLCHRAYQSYSFDFHMERFHPSYFEDPPTLEGDKINGLKLIESPEDESVTQEFVCKLCLFVTSDIFVLYGHMRLECDALCDRDQVLYCLNIKDDERKYEVADQFFFRNDEIFKNAGFICKICLIPFALRIFYDRHISTTHPRFLKEYQNNLLDVNETFSEGNAVSIPSSDLDSDDSSFFDGEYEDDELNEIINDPDAYCNHGLKKTWSKKRPIRKKSCKTVVTFQQDNESEDELEKCVKTFKGPLPDYFSCVSCSKTNGDAIFKSYDKLEEHTATKHKKRRKGSVSDDDYNPEEAENGTEEAVSSEGYVPDDIPKKKSKNIKRKRGKTAEFVNYLKVEEKSAKLSTEIGEPKPVINANSNNEKEPPVTFVCQACRVFYYSHIALDAHISKMHPDYYEVFAREEPPKCTLPFNRFKADDSDLAYLPSGYVFPDRPFYPPNEQSTLPKLPDPEFARKVYGIKDASKSIESKPTDTQRNSALSEPISNSIQTEKPTAESALDILDQALSSLSNSKRNSNAQPDRDEPSRTRDDTRGGIINSTTVDNFEANVYVQEHNVNLKNSECYPTNAEHNFANSCMDCPRFFENLPREVNVNNQAFSGNQPVNHISLPSSQPVYQATHLSEYDRFCNTTSTQSNYANLQNVHNYGAGSFNHSLPHQNFNAGSLNFNPNPAISDNYSSVVAPNFGPAPVQNVSDHIHNQQVQQPPVPNAPPPSSFGFINAYQNYHVNSAVPYENPTDNAAVEDNSDTEDGFGGIPDCNFAEDSQSSVDDPIEGNSEKTFTDISDAKKINHDADPPNQAVSREDDPDDPKLNETTGEEGINEDDKKKLLEQSKREVIFCEECPSYYHGKAYLLKHYKKDHPNCTDKIKELTIGTNRICSECKKEFESNYMMLRHKRSVHEGLRPYACPECGLSFKLKGALTQHQQFTHLVSKPEQCHLCFFSSKYPKGLRYHIKFVHEGVKRNRKPSTKSVKRKRYDPDKAEKRTSYSCQECTVYYYNRKELLAHYEENHSECLEKIEKLKKLIANVPRKREKVASVRRKTKNSKSRKNDSTNSESDSDNETEDNEGCATNDEENSDESEPNPKPTPNTRPSRACRPKNLKEAD